MRGNGELRQIHHRVDRRHHAGESAADVSEVRLARYQLGGQAADREQLLALPEMWRRVEPVAVVVGIRQVVAALRTPTSTLNATRAQLSELIAALDRRLPQVQRAGEEVIVNAAVRLRMEAEKRIAELDGEIAGRKSENSRPVTVA